MSSLRRPLLISMIGLITLFTVTLLNAQDKKNLELSDLKGEPSPEWINTGVLYKGK